MTILIASLPRILSALVTSIAAGLSLVKSALSPLKRAGISVGFLSMFASASSSAGQKATAELNSSGYLNANFRLPMPPMDPP